MRRLTILLAALGALMLVPAAGAFAAGTVTVIPVGEGSGEVDSTTGAGGNGTLKGNPPVECAYDGDTEEASGECGPVEMTSVSTIEGVGLRQTAAQGSEFIEWLPEEAPKTIFCTAGSKYCTVYAPTAEEFEGEATVFALFEPCEEGSEAESCEEEAATQPLTLNINEGEGTVVSNPAGIECTGSEGESCEAEFEEGAEVTLTASPAAGHRFFTWQNCPVKDGRQCTVTMDEAKSVGAKFKKTWDLTIDRSAGSEWGGVNAVPIGVACSYRCTSATDSFYSGEEVTLSAYTFGKKHFAEFTGGTGDAEVCNGETSCSFTIGEEDSSIEALFVQDEKVALDLTKAGGGEAIVKAGGGIECRRVCGSGSAEYWTGTEVTVSWTLAPGTDSIAFSGEAGDCPAFSEAEEGSCHIEMDEAHSFVATLE